MPMTLNTSEFPIYKFKFVLKNIAEAKALYVTAAKFETAVYAARKEADKSNATLAYAGVEAND